MGALDIPGFHTDDASLFRCDYATLAAYMREAGIVADALIVDAPYSDKTHSGSVTTRSDGVDARSLDYAAWGSHDVEMFMAAFHAWPILQGWMVSITDDGLAPVWRAKADAWGRYAFASLPLVERGATCRMSGDGPSSWTTQVCVSRPRTEPWSKWGTLQGAYVGPSERKPVVGGKPLWAMRAIVRDYSRPGDLVCDPCAGGGTTLVAALEEGRRAIGCEPDAGRYEIAVRRIREARRPLPRMAAVKSEQLGLGGE